MSLSSANDTFAEGAVSRVKLEQPSVSQAVIQQPIHPLADAPSEPANVWTGATSTTQAGPSTNKPQPVDGAQSSSATPSASTSVVTTKKDGRHEGRHLWDAAETEALVQGCKKHGVGNWKTVLNDPEFRDRFRPERHPGDLKDKFRTSLPEAYHKLYPNAKTHLPSTSSRKSANDIPQTGFEKGLPKETRRFTPREDAALKSGYDELGSSWTKIAAMPEFGGRRKPTDLRDRFRNAFPALYEQAGYKPRQRPVPKSKRTLSHGSSHLSTSHHDRAVPLPSPADRSKDDLDALIVKSKPSTHPASSMSSAQVKPLGDCSTGQPSLTEPPIGRRVASSATANESEGALPVAQALPSVPRLPSSFASTIPDSNARSLSCSGIPSEQATMPMSSRPPLTSQNSMPAAVSEAVSGPLQSFGSSSRSLEEADASLLNSSQLHQQEVWKQWDMQQIEPPQIDDGLAHQQQRQQQHQSEGCVPSMRRSQSYMGPSTSVEGFPAMDPAPQQQGGSAMAANSSNQSSNQHVADSFYATLQSQSLPPSQMQPADYRFTEADSSPLDGVALKNVHNSLESHRAEGQRQMREKTPQPGQRHSHEALIIGHDPTAEAMDIDLPQHLTTAQAVVDRGTAWQRTQNLDTAVGFDYSFGGRPRTVDSFQDLLDPLGQAASPGLSHTWNLPSVQGFVPVSSGLYGDSSATPQGQQRSEGSVHSARRHNPIAGDLLHRGSGFPAQFDFVNLPLMQLPLGYPDQTAQGVASFPASNSLPDVQGQATRSHSTSVASSEQSISSTPSIVDMLPQANVAVAAQRPANNPRAYSDFATANPLSSSSGSNPYFKASFRYPADDLSLMQTLTPALGQTLSKRRRSTDTLREEGDFDASPTLSFLRPQDFRAPEEATTPGFGRRSVSENEAAKSFRPISRHGLSSLSNLQAPSEHSISTSSSSLLPGVSSSSIAPSSVQSSSDLDNLIPYAESLPDLSSATAAFGNALDDFNLPTGHHQQQQPQQLYSFDDHDINTFLRGGGSTASLTHSGPGGLSPRSWALQLDLPSIWAQQAASIGSGSEEQMPHGQQQQQQRRALSLSTRDPVEMNFDTSRGRPAPSKAYSEYDGESPAIDGSSGNALDRLNYLLLEGTAPPSPGGGWMGGNAGR